MSPLERNTMTERIARILAWTELLGGDTERSKLRHRAGRIVDELALTRGDMVLLERILGGQPTTTRKR